MRVETERFAPYPVHPLPEIDWSQQIAKRGDQRQMENWQRLGVFAAGLALDDAGFKDDLDACGSMDMIVAAGGGERDINVDSLIVDEALKRNDREQLLNEKLTTELRPTLFLAQLSNLLAGNISIVHKVTGSSRTFMGEEGAGISAVETAFARIKAGQSTHTLVGGAFSAEHHDMLLLIEAIQGHAPRRLAAGLVAQGRRRRRHDHRFGRRVPGAGIARTCGSARRPHLCRRSTRSRATAAAATTASWRSASHDSGSRPKQLTGATTVVFSGTSGLHDLAAARKGRARSTVRRCARARLWRR